MAKGKKRERRSEKSESFPLKNILIASAVGTALFLLLLLIASAALLKSDTPGGAYQLTGLAVGSVAAFTGGFIAVRPLRKNGIPYGALTGVIQALVASLAVFIANSASAGTGMLLLMGMMLLFSCAGGVAAVNLKKRKVKV